MHLEYLNYCTLKTISIKFRRGNYFTPHDLICIWNSTWVILLIRKSFKASSPPPPPPQSSIFRMDYISQDDDSDDDSVKDDDADDDDDDDDYDDGSYRHCRSRVADPPEIPMRLGKCIYDGSCLA